MNSKLLDILHKYLPEESVDYCYRLWEENPFHFTVTRSRQTKLGDYRYSSQEKSHTITVNYDLNKFSFLVTYIHEVAHLHTTVFHGHRVKPHGTEWKNKFKELLNPLVERKTFPENIEHALSHYLLNPKASSCSDMDLLKALGTYDEQQHFKYLSEVNISETFVFNNKVFQKESVNRTRAVCKEVASGRKYYISQAAQVEVLQTSIF
ncbi:MAG: SprT-like domain-containing protein [Cytophagaceae bacterium]